MIPPKILSYIRLNPLESLAALLSISGGCFVPSTDPNPRIIGFALWCGGNALWICFAKGYKKWGFLTMQAVYLIQNLIAITNNIWGLF